MSIAGSDPSGGAGIQADLKTFAAQDCHGMAVVTALTAQNTMGISAVHVLPADFVAEQIRMVITDIDVAAVKIGMLGTAEIAAAVAQVLRSVPRVPIVLDPVLVATSGARLSDDTMIAAMARDLFPLATLITPNLDEAARLAEGAPARTRPEVEAVARALRSTWGSAWLVKGGHLADDEAADFLLTAEGGSWLTSPRVSTRNTHGTGCTLSSAIAANLAKGHGLPTAVAAAKAYLARALASADRLQVGRGPGPVDHAAGRGGG